VTLPGLTVKVSWSEDRFQMRHYRHTVARSRRRGCTSIPRSQPTACKVDICVRRWS